MLPRQMKTLVGTVHFSRRVGRCRNDCHGVQQAHVDQELGLVAYQQTSHEVMQMACSRSSICPIWNSLYFIRETYRYSIKQCSSLELGTIGRKKSW